MKKLLIVLSALTLLSPLTVQAKSNTINKTIGIMAMGNIQVVDTNPELDVGPGGGIYFDYRFNQRFSLTLDAWATIHDGDGRSAGDDNIMILGVPTITIKLYFMDDEDSKWDPYAGLGVGLYAIAGSNGANGIGLGGQLALGFDYYFSDSFSAGFEADFRSAGIVTGNNGSAMVPFSLVGKTGYHF